MLPCAARGMSGQPGPTAGAVGATVPPGSTAAPGTGHPLPPSRGERLGTALLSCRDWGHLHAGNLPPAVHWTHSARAPLPGAGTRRSHRAPRQGDLPSRAQRQRGTLLGGAQRVPQDPRSQLDGDCERKAFLTGVQPRDPGTFPSTPGDVAGALTSSEVQAQGTGKAG